eukprot:TRINITY_DN1863_c0_g1_i3.p3 TRINITY_DN1863_c0_g1~~TRINITY_DN1863_c0_g1_i3.p3  ORF type:complete len:105 (+),score=22.84 TRINITY_DN1863_c0_g1_i3:266-580(+)
MLFDLTKRLAFLLLCRMMKGVEYEVVFSQPPRLFVIEKRFRRAPNDATPLARYYVCNTVLYQAPDCASVIVSRLAKASTHLHDALEILRNDVTFSAVQGFGYKS